DDLTSGPVPQVAFRGDGGHVVGQDRLVRHVLAGPRQFVAHPQGQQATEDHEQQRGERELQTNDLVVGGKNVLADETGRRVVAPGVAAVVVMSVGVVMRRVAHGYL